MREASEQTPHSDDLVVRLFQVPPSAERLREWAPEPIEAEITRLRAALDDALMPHSDGCPRVDYDYALMGRPEDCTCGVEELLRKG